MMRSWPRILTLVALMLYGIGAPRHAHLALEHGISGEHGGAGLQSKQAPSCSQAHSHDHETPTDPRPGHDPSGDHCPTCQLLTSNLALALPPLPLAEIERLSFQQPWPAGDRALIACAVGGLGPRGPPALLAS